uniref:protein FAM166B isoform X2 n=1 Tax=Scatophagus argus TaxID=75038 RepID=UPI001ED80DB4|nr:protein FAM166B isoform X2 [Scatophagus argus]
MDKHAPKFSKVSLTPEPYYIPGYTGHCPQLKYSMGKSYAKLTAELLTNPEVRHSDRLVLHTAQPDTALTLSSSNVREVIPGFTGFIPRRQNHFACSYSEMCRKSLSEFYQERRAKTQSADLLPERPKLPLTAVSDKVFIYKPLKSLTPTLSPYLMDADDPHKYFISGFTGHVPKSRYLIGKGFPIITNQALTQFGSQQRRDPTSQNTSGEKDSTVTSMPKIYPANTGLVPSFTGHIPGYKFTYGHTFGQLSKEALEKSGIKRILLEKS